MFHHPWRPPKSHFFGLVFGACSKGGLQDDFLKEETFADTSIPRLIFPCTIRRALLVFQVASAIGPREAGAHAKVAREVDGIHGRLLAI